MAIENSSGLNHFALYHQVTIDFKTFKWLHKF